MQGKIVKGIAGFYYVYAEEGPEGKVYECKAKGIFRKENRKPLVGDDVRMETLKDGTGSIVELLPRRSELVRPAVANIDQALVVFAILRPEPNFNLLDRFLIMMEQQGLNSLICFNKQDIASPEEKQALQDAYGSCGYQVLFLSARKGEGIAQLKALLAGKTTVVAGPSGVGKSSLINGLLNRKSLARTSSQPGKTQTINFYYVNQSLYLVDLPGYGYAKASEEIRAKWGRMVENYLHKSKQLRAVFLLIDIRHAPSANDKQMYQWIVSQGYEPIIIATKLDKIKRSQVAKQLKLLKEELKLLPGTKLLPFSAQTKQGREEIWEVMEKLIEDKAI